MAVEAAAVIPLLLLLIVGMVQFGKVTYVNYTLNKMVYAAGRQLAVQQGVNYCNADDAKVTAAIAFATNDANGQPIIANLPTMQVEALCSDGNGGTAACEPNVCDTLGISPKPQYLRVTIPGGYPVTIRLPFLNPVDISLSPSALVPTGGAL
jgi:Flp pilus assembly protein TadG